MRKTKQQYYQCNNCRYIKLGGGCRCEKCDGAMLKYKDMIGIGVPKLIDGKVYLKYLNDEDAGSLDETENRFKRI